MTSEPGTHVLVLPGAMLQRGYWLYVWRVASPGGEILYVGRTGDNSSPHAAAPFTRMGQHLGMAKNQNALRRHLTARGVDLHHCDFRLVSHGPIHLEVDHPPGASREPRMAAHRPHRDSLGAMEKALADDLRAAGYDVVNRVACRWPLDPAAYGPIRAAFAREFPRLA